MNKASTQPTAIRIPVGNNQILEGNLSLPVNARGLVLFAHGSGSSRSSPRNLLVAQVLQQSGLATLLFDLLTPEEETVDRKTGHLRFNIELLSDRLLAAGNWARKSPDTRKLSLGYFGASTGGGAALVAAAARPELVQAIVCRGGRPDLAGEALPQIKTPTLLIVGSNDVPVIKMNQEAMAKMAAGISKLKIVPGAGHLFEEPGTLEAVAGLARDWFIENLP